MTKLKYVSLLMTILLCIACIPRAVYAGEALPGVSDPEVHGFTLLRSEKLKDFGTTAYYLEHKKSGAHLFYLDDNADERTFSIGFRTPTQDDFGANHVLEHALLCGSEKYPSKNIMYYLRGNSVASLLNAYTLDDSSFYLFKTYNETDYYNLADVYLNAVLYPKILTDENIFNQQGIRREYAGGQVNYNGIVYNELRLKSSGNTENSLDFVANQMYQNVYGATTPAKNSGGTIEGIKQLSYQRVLDVYKTYYTPANSLIHLSGKQDLGRTLGFLNLYLEKAERRPVQVKWENTAEKPKEAVQTFHITPDTKTVDVGIFYPGGWLINSKEAYVREVLFLMVNQEVLEKYPNCYTIGGNAGGLANLAVIFAGVPMEEKEQVLVDYEAVLKRFQTEGLDQAKLQEQISKLQAYKAYSNVGKPLENAMNGFIYGDDPFIVQTSGEVIEYLRTHPDYFKQVLNEGFLQNDQRSVVISETAPYKVGTIILQ